MMIRLGDSFIAEPSAIVCARWDGQFVQIKIRDDRGVFSVRATEAQWQAFRDTATLAPGCCVSPYAMGRVLTPPKIAISGDNINRGTVTISEAPEPEPNPRLIRGSISDYLGAAPPRTFTFDEDQEAAMDESWRDRPSQL